MMHVRAGVHESQTGQGMHLACTPSELYKGKLMDGKSAHQRDVHYL